MAESDVLVMKSYHVIFGFVKILEWNGACHVSATVLEGSAHWGKRNRFPVFLADSLSRSLGFSFLACALFFTRCLF